jgi:hypothetical protein
MAVDDDKKGDDKKARVLHTRIPESLEEEIKKRAGTLGISVSNLVRNVLNNTFGLVEDIVADSAELARRARGEAPAAAERRAPDVKVAVVEERAPRVLGWQEVVLNLNAVCERCNTILKKGTAAMIGVTDGPGARPIVCPACVAREVSPTPAAGRTAEKVQGDEP